jgi:hypothetical protein
MPSAGAHRRRARRGGVCRPCAPVQCRLQSAPPAVPNRPSRGPRPGQLLHPPPHAACATCPDRTQPRQSWLRAGAAGAGGPGASGGSGGVKCFKLPSLWPLLSSPGNWFFSASTLSALPYGLERSGSVRWGWGPSPPTPCSPCGRTHPAPDALCVLGREREVLSEAPPSLRRLLCTARKCTGSPPPAPRPRCATALAAG